MSGLGISFRQQVYDANLPSIEKILHKKLDQLEKYHAIPMEDLSDWKHKLMKDLEEETQEMIGFLEINKDTQKSYFMDTAKVANCMVKYYIENQQLRQEIVQKDTIIDNLLNKFKKTINNKST